MTSLYYIFILYLDYISEKNISTYGLGLLHLMVFIYKVVIDECLSYLLFLGPFTDVIELQSLVS